MKESFFSYEKHISLTVLLVVVQWWFEKTFLRLHRLCALSLHAMVDVVSLELVSLQGKRRKFDATWMKMGRN